MTSDGFAHPGHGLIFCALVALYSRGGPTDALAAGDLLLRHGDLEAAGGASYLHTLTTAVTTPTSAAYWAHIVAEAHALRLVARTGRRLEEVAGTGGVATADVLHWAVGELLETAECMIRDRTISAATAVDGAIEYIEMTCTHDGISEVPTGIPRSTPSRVGWILSAQADVPLGDLRNGTLAPASCRAVARARSRFADAPLHIEDTMTQSIDSIRLTARQRKSTGGLRLLIADHLHLLLPGAARDHKVLAVTCASRSSPSASSSATASRPPSRTSQPTQRRTPTRYSSRHGRRTRARQAAARRRWNSDVGTLRGASS